MISIPLSQSGDPKVFAALVVAHRDALASHRVGPAGAAAPVAHPLIEGLVARVARGDPFPDLFQIIPYEIVDDTPRTPEHQHALDVLRETLAG